MKKLLLLPCLIFFYLSSLAQTAYINEFHYDNDGGDTFEFVEVAIPLDDVPLCTGRYTVIHYNGDGGGQLWSKDVSDFVAGVEEGGFKLYYFDVTSDGKSLQNGAPDGIALISEDSACSPAKDSKNKVIALVEFISYEGSFVGTTGLVNGVTSTDVGVSEPGTTPIGSSICRGDFNPSTGTRAWATTTDDTPGAINNTGGCAQTTLPIELSTFSSKVSENQIELVWVTASESNNAGFEVQELLDGEFQTISFVEGRGTSIESQNYVYCLDNLPSGKHTFRLKQIDFDGETRYSDELEVMLHLEASFELTEAYPNPFNPQTAFSLTTASAQEIQVEVFNLLGQRVAEIYNGFVEANEINRFTFDASGLPSGTYIYRAVGENFVTAKHFVLAK